MTHAEITGHTTARFPSSCPWCGHKIGAGEPISKLDVDGQSDWIHTSHVPFTPHRRVVQRCPGCLHGLVFPPDRWRNGKHRPSEKPGKCLNPNCDLKGTA